MPKIEKEESAEDVGSLSSNEVDAAAAAVYRQQSPVKDDDLVESDGGRPVKKKAKVMLPSLGSPRGLRTLLPG